MPTIDFFDSQLEASKIKTQIVAQYFWVWSKVIIPWAKAKGNKIAYIDLFCGPGRYKDGSPSTPLEIIDRAISSPDLANMLVTSFNDGHKGCIENLEQELLKYPGVEKLKYPPVFSNEKVGSVLTEQLKKAKLIPSLVFIDPFGYKGLTLELISNVIKDWGCDCIFFFNYRRINAALVNPKLAHLADELFGKESADKLRMECEKDIPPEKRERLVLDAFFESLRVVKGYYNIHFRFCDKKKDMTSHYIILVSKNVLAYNLMKEIMANHSSYFIGGEIPSYEYDPKHNKGIQTKLFEENPIHILSDNLVKTFKGKNLTVKQIYEQDNLGKPYILKNYKSALLQLEESGRISINPPAHQRPKRLGRVTLGDDKLVTFK